MGDLLHEAFLPVNIACTVLLILMMLYWIMVILGALDLDIFDIDFDADADADADMDVEIQGGFLRSLLGFFYIGEVPIMILVSIFVFAWWSFSLFGNSWLNPGRTMLLGIPIAAGGFVASGFITKLILTPFRGVLGSFTGESKTKIIGRICIVTTTRVSDKLGQAEIKTKGAPIVLNVRTEGGAVLERGAEAVVVSKDEQTGVYLIAPVELE